MSDLIRSRKEYGRPIFVAVAAMLVALFVVVAVLSSSNNMSISAIRQASTIVFLAAWLLGGVIYAVQSNQVRKPRRATRGRMAAPATGNLATPATGNLAATRS